MIFLSIYLVSILLASVLGYFYVGETMNIYYMSACSVATGVGAIAFCAVMRARHEKWSYFSASSLFVLGFWAVHFFFAAIISFEEEVQNNAFLWRFPDLANYTILVGTIAFCFFLLGYLLFMAKPPRVQPERIASISQSDLSRLLLIAPVVSIVNFSLFLLVVGPAYLSGAYAGSSNWGTGATYLFLFFEIFFYLTLALEVYKIRIRSKGKPMGVLQYVFSFNIVTLALLFFYLVFNVYIGDRGPILTTLFICIAGYDFFIKRFKLITVLVAVALGVMAMAFISNYRTRDASKTITERVEQAGRKAANSEWYSAPGELGSSVRVLNTGIALAESDGLWWGKFQAVNILGLIPMAKSFVIRVLHLNFGMTSSTYLTWNINGIQSSVGTGSTIVADVYLDWGVTGVIIVFFILGRFMAWLELNVAHSHSLYLNCLYLLVLSNALYWGRATLLINLNRWVWSLLILWAAHRFWLGRRYNQERRPKRSFLG
jgi:hypothetical protein